MTGPARTSGIITLLLWWLPALCLAASPRDAVRELPSFTHQSIFNVSSADGKQHYFNDKYSGYWTIDWRKQVKLGTTQADLHLWYQQLLTDNLNQLSGSSSDYRRDNIVSELNLKTAGQRLKGLMKFTQVDGYSGQGHTNNPRVWNPASTWEFSINWNLPQMPTLSAYHRVSRNATYKGTVLTRSSESAGTTIRAQYKPDGQLSPHGLGQNYQVQIERSEQTDMLAQLQGRGSGKGNSVNKLRWEGQRQWKVGLLGNLNVGYTFEERSSGSPANINPSTTYSTSYFLNLGGSVRGFPLSYGFNYRTGDVGFSGGKPGRLNTLQSLNLEFKPPVPSGKSAKLNLNHSIEDYQDQNNYNRTERQKISWSFRPNPRVNSSVVYEMITNTQSFAATRTKEQEVLSGNLSYEIPGGQGTFNGGLVQDILRNPRDSKTNVRNSISLRQSFKLGERANMNLHFSQTYDDNRSSVFNDNQGLDTLQAGFNYNVWDGRYINLRAGWKTRLQQRGESVKSNREDINVEFNFNRGDNWRYQLVINTATDSRNSLGSALASDYTASDNVTATITYSF